jgi:hypothetical protein
MCNPRKTTETDGKQLPNADENDKGNPRQIHKHSKLIKGSQNKN